MENFINKYQIYIGITEKIGGIINRKLNCHKYSAGLCFGHGGFESCSAS